MICRSCGNPVQGAFCSRCGAQVQSPPPPMYPAPMQFQPRVQQHVQTLGILWCVYGAYRAATGIFAALFLLGITSHRFLGPWGPGAHFMFMRHAQWMSGVASLVAVYILISAVLAFTVGFSLMARRPWGRTLAIVMAILSLIKIPFGTALGIYTLWVLVPAESGAEYDAIAARS
jgi:hypothetical protein